MVEPSFLGNCSPQGNGTIGHWCSCRERYTKPIVGLLVLFIQFMVNYTRFWNHTKDGLKMQKAILKIGDLQANKVVISQEEEKVAGLEKKCRLKVIIMVWFYESGVEAVYVQRPAVSRGWGWFLSLPEI